jgi:hypothetical protein
VIQVTSHSKIQLLDQLFPKESRVYLFKQITLSKSILFDQYKISNGDSIMAVFTKDYEDLPTRWNQIIGNADEFELRVARVLHPKLELERNRLKRSSNIEFFEQRSIFW